NLTDRSGTALSKVHRIQESGIHVWCGMIVGFDTDDESVFAAQRQFLEQSRIPMALVSVMFAIPQTPLFERLAKEGRLGESDEMGSWGTAVSTNVIPLRMSQRALCDGYLQLM